MRHHIEEVLLSCGGKINGDNGAAAVLGIHPNTLRNRMKKIGIAFGRKHIGINKISHITNPKTIRA